MNRRLKSCPVCNTDLVITRLHCPACDTTIEGNFTGGDMGALTPAQQEFVKVFLCAEGNLKEVGRLLGISYPTVKNRLAEITTAMCGQAKSRKLQLLEDIEQGRISVETALKHLDQED